MAIIDSRGGELAIRWSKADGESRDAAPLVFAQTSLIVRIENPQLIRVEADVEGRAARGERPSSESVAQDAGVVRCVQAARSSTVGGARGPIRRDAGARGG